MLPLTGSCSERGRRINGYRWRCSRFWPVHGYRLTVNIYIYILLKVDEFISRFYFAPLFRSPRYSSPADRSRSQPPAQLSQHFYCSLVQSIRLIISYRFPTSGKHGGTEFINYESTHFPVMATVFR